jgi:hypothetical protein
MTNLVDGKHVVFGNAQRVVAAANRQRRYLIFEFRSGEYSDDAGMLTRSIGIDALDRCVRIMASQNRDVEHIGQSDVVDILARPANQLRILAPLDSGAN